MTFADSWFDFGLQEGILGIVRIIATIGGAIVGWFACDPLTRLFYRVSFRGATPGTLLLGTKFSGAAALALLIYFFLPLGGGSGFGLGAGLGGGHGKGAGAGGDKAASADGAKDKKVLPKDKTDPLKAPPLESIEIEIISVDRYKDDERFYLVKRADPALTHAEMAEYFKKNHEKIEVTPILTGDSFDATQPDNPLSNLLKLSEEYKVKTLQTKNLKTPPNKK